MASYTPSSNDSENVKLAQQFIVALGSGSEQELDAVFSDDLVYQAGPPSLQRKDVGKEGFITAAKKKVWATVEHIKFDVHDVFEASGDRVVVLAAIDRHSKARHVETHDSFRADYVFIITFKKEANGTKIVHVKEFIDSLALHTFLHKNKSK